MQRVLNERLGGLALREIRATFADRLRDATASPDAGELLDIILAEGDGLFDIPEPREAVMLGSASVLIEQPEFCVDASRCEAC